LGRLHKKTPGQKTKATVKRTSVSEIHLKGGRLRSQGILHSELLLRQTPLKNLLEESCCLAIDLAEVMSQGLEAHEKFVILWSLLTLGCVRVGAERRAAAFG